MILTIDPKNPKKLLDLAGYLGEPSIVFARIKGREKLGIAKVGIWIETPRWVEWQRYPEAPVQRSIEYHAEPDKWEFKDVQEEAVIVHAAWSWPDEESEQPTPAEGVGYQDGRLVSTLDERGWSSYDPSVNSWREGGGQPVYIEDMARFWGLEGIDLDLSEVAAFLRSQRVDLP